MDTTRTSHRITRFFLIQLLIFGFALSVDAQTQPKRILFFGDSLTAGYGVHSDEAYPARIAELAKKDGYAVEVFNAGVSGDTSAGGLRRVAWVLRQPFDIFVLALGANDGLRGLSPAAMETNLREILAQVQAKNPKAYIVVAGMQALPGMGTAYSDEFRRVFDRIAHDTKTTSIPFLLEGVAGNPALNQADRVHPNAQGQAIMASKIWPIIKGLL